MKFFVSVCFSVFLFIISGCAAYYSGSKLITGQHPCKLDKKTSRNIQCNYLLFLPEGYMDGKKAWPVILFLHGAGERGNNLELVKKHGPPKIVEQRKDFPFIVISPQCPEGVWWTNDVLITLLDDITERYRVDTSRIYLTGLSMGGFGTWNLAMEYPDRFAAIAPICGGGNKYTVSSIRNIPAWVFHGARDKTVPLSASQEMVDALKKAGGDVKFTVYPEAEHDSWTETYNNQELYDWFMQHHK